MNMSAVDFKFNPSDATVNSGDVTFNLKNDGQQPHSLEIEDVNGQDQEIEGDVAPGRWVWKVRSRSSSRPRTYGNATTPARTPT